MLENNLFAYCFNNPVNNYDPSGCWPKWIGTALKVAAIVVVTAVVVAAVVVAAPAVAGAVAATAAFYGASAAVAGALATAVTIGCAAVATGVAVTGVNRAVEAATGTNYGEKVMGEKNYETFESTVNIAAMMITAVPQTTPYPSTGRSEPQNLKEQVGMNLARANPGSGSVINKISMSDPRMPGWMGWQKYQQNFSGGTGVNIHYVGHKVIPIFFDFKFKE